jgi:hypothetical protein
MSQTKQLVDLKPEDTAWYRGKDGTVYEVRVATVAKASPSSLPAWAHILWTDIEGGMIVMHPERDLMAENPNPPQPEPVVTAPLVEAAKSDLTKAETVPEVQVSQPIKRSRSRSGSGAAAREGA